MKFFHKLQSFFTHKSPRIKQLEKQIKYRFRDTYYLDKALTHRSIKTHYEGNYERLEFLGDAIIDHVVSYWLFNKYIQSDEGALTKKRAALVNREFLAMLGNKLNVIDSIQIIDLIISWLARAMSLHIRQLGKYVSRPLTITPYSFTVLLEWGKLTC